MTPSSKARTPVTDMTTRMRRRKAKVWRRRIIGGLVVLLALALVAGVVWLVGFSSVLASHAVSVKGNTTLTTEEVVAKAQVPMGVPLVHVDTGAIASRVQQFPQVESAKVNRAWPETVEIVVTERTAVYVLKTQADGLRLVDKAGVPYLPAGENHGLPVAQVKDPGSVRVLTDVATLVAALTPALKAGTISAESPDSLAVSLADGKQVFFGSVDDVAQKVDVATKLMAAVPDAKVYDVSAPSRPVTR